MLTPRVHNEHALAMYSFTLSRQGLTEKLQRLATRVSERDFRRQFEEAIGQLEQELHAEETWLDACDAQDWHDCLETHGRILSAVHHVRARVMQGDIAVGREAARLLADWFAVYSAGVAHALMAWQQRRPDNATLMAMQLPHS